MLFLSMKMFGFSTQSNISLHYYVWEDGMDQHQRFHLGIFLGKEKIGISAINAKAC